MFVIHPYKGFNIVKTGTSEYPWNIYKDTGRGFGDHVGFEKTIKECKYSIDIGLFDEVNEKLLQEEYLTEMADVLGRKVRVEKINFSFYFSQAQGQHTIRAKICWNREKLYHQFDGIIQLFGEYKYISSSNPTKKPSQKDINQAREFFKKYKVLFAACWDDKLQPADVVDYLEGHIDFRELLKNFYGINNYHKLLDSNDVTELYNIVKKYNIFNLYDGRLVE